VLWRKDINETNYFATGNAGKMREIREIMADMPVEVVSMKEAGILADIEENGTTFVENAKIKATEIAKQTKDIVLADDSGLEVDYLNKEPGVYSARYLGEDTPYEVKKPGDFGLSFGCSKGKKNSTICLCDCSSIAGWKGFNDSGNN